MHPLASPILCPDEILKEFPPMLMFVSDSEFVYKESSTFSLTYWSDASVFCKAGEIDRDKIEIVCT